MNYIAHTRENICKFDKIPDSVHDNDVQTVQEHLEGTALLSEKFAVPELKTLLYNSGLLHDIGKYQQGFQDRIRGSHLRVDHSTSGAIEAGKNFQPPVSLIMEYIIAGHHAGIPDGGTESGVDESCLAARMERDQPKSVDMYKKEICLSPMSASAVRRLAVFMTYHLQNMKQEEMKKALVDEFAFIVRYCFSCLVDADSLDTEHFCQNIQRETLHSDYSLCLKRLDRTFEEYARERTLTPLQQARTRLQNQAYKNILKDADIYLMNMPTGSGKTLCSAKCALLKAISEKKKHIIYIIPYNSIISQTADEFERIFNTPDKDGGGKAANILRHQSTYSIEDDENADDAYKIHVSQATENWDADIIITTLVQFFETVFSNKRSKLRKMHNMADSVLIIDEAHLMPFKYFQPCLESIAYLTKMFGSKAILLTATMPEYQKLLLQYTFHDLEVVSLIPDQSDFKFFKKCDYRDLGTVSYIQLAEKAGETSSALIVVNGRNTAREIYKFLNGDQNENIYHLSTYMTKYDLNRSISEIKQKLKIINETDEKQNAGNRKPLIVISTSLIEAGVDLDFQTAFRECTGLDSILQTGGRCNREGRRKMGHVYIFEREGAKKHADDIKRTVTKSLLKEYEDIDSPECVQEYFRRVYECNGDKILSNSMHNFMQNQGLELNIKSIPFRSYEAKLIDSLDESVIVPENKEAVEMVNQMKFHGISRSLMRKIQKYTCSVPPKMMETLLKQGAIEEVSGGRNAGGVFALINIKYYKTGTGIQLEGSDYFI